MHIAVISHFSKWLLIQAYHSFLNWRPKCPAKSLISVYIMHEKVIVMGQLHVLQLVYLLMNMNTDVSSTGPTSEIDIIII